MAYSFRKLTINGSVSSSGNKSFKKVIPEESDPLQGTWVWNDTINLSFTTNPNTFLFNYTSNDTIHTSIRFITNSTSLNRIYYGSSITSDSNVVYDNRWIYDLYKTIEITSTYEELIALNDETKASTFLALLQANATKQ